MKIDATVKKETLYVCVGTAVFSALMNGVFLLIGQWNIGVLYSNLLVGGAMLLNFFALGMTVQKAVSFDDEGRAKMFMKMSQSVRFIAMIGVLAVGVMFSDIRNSSPFTFWALLPPLFFNRMTIMIRGLTIKNDTPAVGDGKHDPDDREDGAD